MDDNSNILSYKGRLLVKKEGLKLVYNKGKLFLTENGEQITIDLAKYSKGLKKIGLRLRILDRLLRLEPRCATKVKKGVLISWQGRILKIQNDGNVICEHTYRKGMNNPLSFTRVEKLEGFEDGIIYGEYFSNSNREAVGIWHRNIEGEWKKLYEFPVNTINHIHSLVTDGANNRILILTGDSNDESCIWETRNNFKSVEKLLGGSQKYRSCVAFPFGEDIIYATDTPLEDNYVYVLKRNETEPVELMKLQGSCIYGTTFLDKNNVKQFVFVTAVEPDSSLAGWKYRTTYKLGKGITDRYSYINLISENGEKKILFKAKKDILPMWLFQFGNFRVAETDNSLAVSGQALYKYDGRTIEFNI